MAPSSPLSKIQLLALTALGTWTAVKVAITGSMFLLIVPTYFNDSYTNWNLRGKVFYETQSLTLELPRNTDPTVSVSSYPPAVPLLKASIAAIAGEWNEAAINSPHLLWFLCSLMLCYYALRRYVSRAWSLIGVYALASLPLVLIHGTNAYADVFLSVSIMAAVLPVFYALGAKTKREFTSFLRVGSIGTALLIFTKNEALVLYLPPLLLVAALLFYTRSIDRRQFFTLSLGYILPFVFVLCSWIGYKFMHGLAFGNAQHISTLSFHWQPGALQSILGMTFLEGNWLLLFPIFFILLIAERTRAFSHPLFALSIYILAAYIMQLYAFLFTRLSLEAVKQTGYARGLIHIVPLIVILSVILMQNGMRRRLD